MTISNTDALPTEKQGLILGYEAEKIPLVSLRPMSESLGRLYFKEN
jgi:hypothetical protein